MQVRLIALIDDMLARGVLEVEVFGPEAPVGPGEEREETELAVFEEGIASPSGGVEEQRADGGHGDVGGDEGGEHFGECVFGAEKREDVHGGGEGKGEGKDGDSGPDVEGWRRKELPFALRPEAVGVEVDGACAGEDDEEEDEEGSTEGERGLPWAAG